MFTKFLFTNFVTKLNKKIAANFNKHNKEVTIKIDKLHKLEKIVTCGTCFENCWKLASNYFYRS
ncbi:hypothetical protein BpHYR1_026864 [Brachionus plicatilis]|uniref:Uncharacterized protein n=1 Tax=Brachionus plicatilis TaxID=10195 RepID=A0A3M7RNR3_BRAPC|nr:hypothetical protein BpHYR1_026864 [Brachionus plicatilis]